MDEVAVVTLPDEILRRISREAMLDLPIRRYEGEVRLVAAPAELERALADILQEGVVGFDTETRPAFRKGESYLPCLAQVATARAVYLSQLQRQDFSGAMSEILGAEGTVKAGVSLADDLRSLRKMMAFEERSIVDVGQVARRHGLKQTACATSRGFLGFRIPRGRRRRTGGPRLSGSRLPTRPRMRGRAGSCCCASGVSESGPENGSPRLGAGLSPSSRAAPCGRSLMREITRA